MVHTAVMTKPNSPRKTWMLIFSGERSNYCCSNPQGGNCYTNDIWALETATCTWVKRRLSAASGAPPRPRYGPTAWRNTHLGAVQITGGTCGAACGACGTCGHANDTFSAALAQPAGVSWAQTRQAGAGPPPRDRHTFVLIDGAVPRVLDWGEFVKGKD